MDGRATRDEDVNEDVKQKPTDIHFLKCVNLQYLERKKIELFNSGSVESSWSFPVLRGLESRESGDEFHLPIRNENSSGQSVYRNSQTKNTLIKINNYFHGRYTVNENYSIRKSDISVFRGYERKTISVEL